MANGVVPDEAGATIHSVSIHAVVCAKAAKVVPDVLTAHVGARFISPAEIMKVDCCAGAIVADELSEFVNIGALVSLTPMVIVHVVEEEAAVVARVRDERLECANVVLEQVKDFGFSHHLNVIWFFSCYYFSDNFLMWQAQFIGIRDFQEDLIKAYFMSSDVLIL